MYLEKNLAEYFHPRTRERGQQLFRQRRVRITRGNQWEVAAEVLGSQLYEVDLERNGDEISIFCECQAYVEFGVCKHIWATLLEADRRSYLIGRFGSSKPRLLGQRPVAPGAEITDPDDRPPSRWRSLLRPPVPAFSPTVESWPASREIHYAISLDSPKRSGSTLQLDVLQRERKRNGDWAKAKPIKITRGGILGLRSELDREVLSLLAGVPANNTYMFYTYGNALPPSYSLRMGLASILLPRICATGRCWYRTEPAAGLEGATPIDWDPGEAWRFRVGVKPEASQYEVNGYLERDRERMELTEPDVLLEEGLLVARGKAARLDVGGNFHLLTTLREEQKIEVPRQEGTAFVQELLSTPQPPAVDWPEELKFRDDTTAPTPRLVITRPPRRAGDSNRMVAQLFFMYADVQVAADHDSGGFFDPANKRYLRRDGEAEDRHLAELHDAGVRRSPDYTAVPDSPWEFNEAKLPQIVRQLTQLGWKVEAEGKAFRHSTSYEAELTSGIDWFELHGYVDYGGARVTLPALLKALRQGSQLVKLDDGSYGFIPEEFTARFGALLQFGQAEEEHVRYHRGQAGLLDVFLAERPEVRTDEVFAQARRHMRDFKGIAPADQPAGFRGSLREYQREGIGWMQFLQGMRFGGCLADDMGVGKTPQVLALLEMRRLAGAGPSLVVVPRSLVYNWRQEAERFTPELRVLDNSGASRYKDPSQFASYDLVLTTYGALLRDIPVLKDFKFDYAILDEAQAIKNPASESAKATRLLTANHRLVLTGTPIENHLGDLWSIFEFLNPGLLGASPLLSTSSSVLRNPAPETRALISHALRPFILRRTKQQVVAELPEKTEQTLFCEMDAEQRKLYNELRDHYRQSLLGKIETDGLAKSKMHVLEALLRLRQAACHPGLIDIKRREESSAKLEALLPQITEVIEEGHKALVFSQFTSLLAIVQKQLDDANITYEYLDGKTKDRQGRVERFQNDPDCRLFLVSLKAGGVGLNLTAAEYVFLLDPWWNPAVESQAIDRAHRIGQQKPVFAYRLIARDTVEEKVLLLQQSKRDLADAIIGEDKRLIAKLKREDLEMLLS